MSVISVIMFCMQVGQRMKGKQPEHRTVRFDIRKRTREFRTSSRSANRQEPGSLGVELKESFRDDGTLYNGTSGPIKLFIR